jgi:hypothetical protein
MTSHLTMSTRTIAGLLSGLLFAIVIPLNAQSARDGSRYYDIRQEITLTGVVSGVLIKAGPGMMMGSHLFITTVSGPMDVSLGRWGLQGADPQLLSTGRQVEITGLSKTFENKKVFIARIMKVGDKVVGLRNEYGIPMSPQARKRGVGMGRSGSLYEQ